MVRWEAICKELEASGDETMRPYQNRIVFKLKLAKNGLKV